uniref:Uncharacterized protein n=1 Tax=Rhizophora mucronata TaxID=61149 RepID=A0A2P2PCE0_RHIMU
MQPVNLPLRARFPMVTLMVTALGNFLLVCVLTWRNF